MSKVLFFCHDNPKPAGGIRTLYRHVNLLNQHGIEAYIVHFSANLSLDWFSHKVPVLHAGPNLSIAESDWIVIPEDFRAAIEFCSTVNCNKAVFCQNHFYIFKGLSDRRNWADFGIKHIMASSNEIQHYIQDVFGLPSTFFPYAINHKVFYPDDSKRQLRIAYMPRKGEWNLEVIKGILWHKYPELRKIPWVAIHGMTEMQVANTLRRCSVFLSTGFMEGFGLPPIEAMACGSMVLGFRAGGGKDFATEGNGFWIPDEDPITFAHTLARVLKEIKDNPDSKKWSNIRSAAYTTSKRYTDDKTEEAVLQFWKQQLQ
jgi:hypothetical protein